MLSILTRIRLTFFFFFPRLCSCQMAALSASALQAVKLKKTGEEAMRDRRAPQYTPCEESSDKEEERRRYFFSTGLDQWYKSLKDVTIPSIFLSLTADEASFKHKHNISTIRLANCTRK